MVLKPLAEKGRSGWLWRVYPEPWQLHRQSREDLALIETYEERPTPQMCVDRLKLP